MAKSTVTQFVLESDATSARVEATYHKVTWRLMSFIFVCWVLNYLDRVNVSFAQLHLKQDLGLSDAAYGLGVSLFFIGYISLEVPSTLWLKKIGARLTISRIMILWGGISTAMAFMTTPTQFYVARILLGAAEAGFWPGIILYLTYWYPGARRARITSRFLLAIAAAGIIGGPLSGWILHNFVDIYGYKNWQWLFFLEGLPALLMGIVAFFYLVDKPQDARWLDDDQKKIILDALAADRAEKKPSKHGKHQLLAALKDPRVYILAAGWGTVPLCGTILNYWTPTIIRQAGVADVLNVGLLSALPYIIGALGMFIVARSSDVTLERRWHFFGCTAIGGLGGFLLPLVSGSTVASIVCLGMISISYFGAAAIIWSIPPAYLTDEAAAAGIGAISSLGQVGAFCGPIALGWIKTVTGSLAIGLSAIAALVVLGGLAVLIGVPANTLREHAEKAS
ncbi:d-galactonate transporter [Caballeronia arationis]|uniref:D-galactonate transporter n=1 Tax=Caballeronia arationis TaxID=1777142 RepID=A0A7Z7I623_9BURK|nr:MFS transporter [Caballeronia arationis]SAK85686.1 d-galactonate transporter [Caballeronia arationis]SOE66608.1 D-galactonate transporter [Caballeronia arationis]